MIVRNHKLSNILLRIRILILLLLYSVCLADSVLFFFKSGLMYHVRSFFVEDSLNYNLFIMLYTILLIKGVELLIIMGIYRRYGIRR